MVAAREEVVKAKVMVVIAEVTVVKAMAQVVTDASAVEVKMMAVALEMAVLVGVHVADAETSAVGMAATALYSWAALSRASQAGVVMAEVMVEVLVVVTCAHVVRLSVDESNVWLTLDLMASGSWSGSVAVLVAAREEAR